MDKLAAGPPVTDDADDDDNDVFEVNEDSADDEETMAAEVCAPFRVPLSKNVQTGRPCQHDAAAHTVLLALLPIRADPLAGVRSWCFSERNRARRACRLGG